MNKVILTGRLTKDAELSFLPNSGLAKMTYTLAVERNFQKDKNNKKVDFIACEQLGKGTESLCQYVTKGKKILVEGELNVDSYTDKEGNHKTFWKVKVDRLEFLENKNEALQPPEGFAALDDDDIPF